MSIKNSQSVYRLAAGTIWIFFWIQTVWENQKGIKISKLFNSRINKMCIGLFLNYSYYLEKMTSSFEKRQKNSLTEK